MSNYETNWNDVDLSREYNHDLNILEPYDFGTILLELHCNMPSEKITKEEVIKHGREVLKAKYSEALQILESNAENIAQKVREEHEE